MADRFYCPRCGQKKLEKVYARVKRPNGQSSWHYTLVCSHNSRPKTWRGRQNYDPDKTPPCGLVIEVPGRDATLDDYDNVLYQVSAAALPEIQRYLFRQGESIHKRGFEVLYEGTLIDVVRVRHDSHDGVVVLGYWHGNTWDKSKSSPDTLSKHHEAGSYIKVPTPDHPEGVALQDIILNPAIKLWHKDKDYLFTGSYGLKLKNRIINWVKRLETQWETLHATHINETNRWDREEKEFQHALDKAKGTVSLHIRHYSGANYTARLYINGKVDVDSIERAAKFLGTATPSFKLLQQGSALNIDQVRKIQESSGETYVFPPEVVLPPRMTREQAIGVLNALNNRSVDSAAA